MLSTVTRIKPITATVTVTITITIMVAVTVTVTKTVMVSLPVTLTVIVHKRGLSYSPSHGRNHGKSHDDSQTVMAKLWTWFKSRLCYSHGRHGYPPGEAFSQSQAL